MTTAEELGAFSSETRRLRQPHAVPRPRAATRIDLSIVIITWNSERWIDRCLRAVPAACAGLAYEVIVYDNASGDRTAEFAADTAASPSLRDIATRLMHSPTNLGFAGGTNRAAREARGRYLFFLNPDCELAPDALRLLFEFLESHPEASAAAPLLSDESGVSQREFQLRRLPTVGTLACEILLLDKLFPRNGATARYRYRDLDLTEPRRIEQPAAAALLLRKDAWEEVGPLDEQFAPAWFEDVDYCRRLAEAGLSSWVVPAARARHFGGASLEHVSFQRFVDVWYRNMFLYARKWLSSGEAETLRWIIMLGMLLRLVPAALGLAHRDVGRWHAMKAYARVLKKAFHRWDDASRSS